MNLLLQTKIFHKEILIKRLRSLKYFENKDEVYSIPCLKVHYLSKIIRIITKGSNFQRKYDYFSETLKRINGFQRIDPVFYNQDCAHCRWVRKAIKQIKTMENFTIDFTGKKETLKKSFFVNLFQLLRYFKKVKELNLKFPKQPDLSNEMQKLSVIISRLRKLRLMSFKIKGLFLAENILLGLTKHIKWQNRYFEAFKFSGVNLAVDIAVRSYISFLFKIPKIFPGLSELNIELGSSDEINKLVNRALQQMQLKNLRVTMESKCNIEIGLIDLFSSIPTLLILDLELFPRLKSLREINWTPLEKGLQSFQQLQTVKLLTNIELCIISFIRGIKNLKLQQLQIESKMSENIDNVLKILGPLLNYLIKLEVLSLSFKGLDYPSKLKDEGFFHFSNAISNLSKLKTLKFECPESQITDKALKLFCKYLAGLKFLRSLFFDVYSDELTDASFLELTLTICKLKHIKELSLIIGSNSMKNTPALLVGGLLSHIRTPNVNIILHGQVSEKEKKLLTSILKSSKVGCEWIFKCGPEKAYRINPYLSVMPDRRGFYSTLLDGFKEMIREFKKQICNFFYAHFMSRIFIEIIQKNYCIKMNAPDKSELYMIPEDHQKQIGNIRIKSLGWNIQKIKNFKIQACFGFISLSIGTFTIFLEDHTLGNMMRMQYIQILTHFSRQLLKDRDVKFAGFFLLKRLRFTLGYKMPHPLFNKIEIKVETNSEKRPTEAFIKAIDALQDDIKSIQKDFDKKVKEFANNQMM